MKAPLYYYIYLARKYNNNNQLLLKYIKKFILGYYNADRLGYANERQSEAAYHYYHCRNIILAKGIDGFIDTINQHYEKGKQNTKKYTRVFRKENVRR